MTKDVRYGVTFSVVNVTTCKLHVFHFSSLGANTLSDSIIEYNAVRCHWEYNSAEYNSAEYNSAEYNYLVA